MGAEFADGTPVDDPGRRSDEQAMTEATTSDAATTLRMIAMLVIHNGIPTAEQPTADDSGHPTRNGPVACLYRTRDVPCEGVRLSRATGRDAMRRVPGRGHP
ncbi:hypothetical protein GCM10022243_40590 [Saccharothrix violaceirubra]